MNTKTFSITSDPSQVQKWIRSQRRHFQYPITISIDYNKGLIERWTVFSQGKRSTLVRYLFGKWLWDELTSEEWRVFILLPEVLSDYKIFIPISKNINESIPKKIIRKRLEDLSKIMSIIYLTKQQYKSISSQSNFLLYENRSRLAKTPKFSGYTKHYKDKGNLPREKTLMPSETLEFEEIDDSIQTIFSFYLTVGKIFLPSGEIILS